MALPWFRMYAEFAGDPVVQSLAFEDQRHYIMLLCLKCSGTLDRDLSNARRELIIHRGLGLDASSAAEAKRRLLEVGLIDKNWHPSGWDKRQYSSDVSTDRVRNYRKNKKVGNVSETEHETEGNSFGNAPDTEQNRTDTETEEKNAGKPATPVCPHEDIQALYHEILPMCPTVKVWNDTRQGLLRQRWRENKNRQTLDWWRKYFNHVAQSKFLTGQVAGSNGKPPFIADLQWLISPENFAKVLEGKYHREAA